MRTRIVVGLASLFVVVGTAWLGDLPFAVLGTAALLIGGYEFYAMLRTGGFHPQAAIGLAWLALLALALWRPAWFHLTSVLSLGFVAAFIWALTVHDAPVNGLLATALPALYLGTMGGQVLALRALPNGFWWLLLGFLVTWGNDTFAYFAGTFAGRRKIWPRLSPKKTWEGTIAGWVGAAVVAVCVVWLTPLAFSLGLAALLGLLGGVLGFFGDLTISMVKRQVGAKDSGHFFPGHGGMLDRLDSMLFVLPFVYQAALLLK